MEHKQYRIFSIRLAIVIGIYTTCWEEDTTGDTDKCHFPIVNMVEEDMRCDQSDKVVYQGRIIGTKSFSPGAIIDYINKWVSSSNSQTISVDEDRANVYNMGIDKTCPVYLASPTDPSCTPQVDVINIANVILIIVIVILMSSMIILLVQILAYVIKSLKIIRTKIVYDNCKNKLNKY